MKRKAKLTILISSVLLLALGAAFAETTQPRYVTIRTLVSTLRINSGTATCIASVTTGSATCTSRLSATLQRSSNGSGWIAVDSWTAMGSGHMGASIGETTSVSSGYEYRLLVKATIENGDGIVIETASKVSHTVGY